MKELDKSAENISSMFNDIAHKYDFLNHFFSMGIDKIWRKKLRRNIAKSNPTKIIDIATGTGDLAIELAKTGCNQIIGIDIAQKMIDVGCEKVKKHNLSEIISLQLGNAEKIEYSDNYFDAATCAFGVRNFNDLDKGLTEINRVLRKGGRVAVLEFSLPKNKLILGIYNFYFHKILPFLGKKISKSQTAYSYLPSSVEKFYYGKSFAEKLIHNGFSNVKIKTLSLGIASIYFAEK